MAEQEQTPTTAELQANHPTMKWFDKMEVTIKKRDYRNRITQRPDVQILGWEITKKIHHVFIEPDIAKDLNHFALGLDINGRGEYYVPRDEHKPGDMIRYDDPNYSPLADSDVPLGNVKPVASKK